MSNIIKLLEDEEAQKHGLSNETMDELEAVFGKDLTFMEAVDRFAASMMNGEAPKREDETKKETDKLPVFYGVKEVAEILQCSIPTARGIMARKDFPSKKIANTLKVSKEALLEWSMQKMA